SNVNHYKPACPAQIQAPVPVLKIEQKTECLQFSYCPVHLPDIHSIFDRFYDADQKVHPDKAHPGRFHYGRFDPHLNTAYRQCPVALASRSTFGEPSLRPDLDVHNDQNAQTAHHGFFHVRSHQYVSAIVTRSVPFQHNKMSIIEGVTAQYSNQHK